MRGFPFFGFLLMGHQTKAKESKDKKELYKEGSLISKIQWVVHTDANTHTLYTKDTVQNRTLLSTSHCPSECSASSISEHRVAWVYSDFSLSKL